MVRVGKLKKTYIDPPTYVGYEFVRELVIDGSPDYMGGEDRLWGNFTRSQMRRVADRLVAEKGYTNIERAEIDSWVDSLPWDGEWEGERYIDLYFEA